MAFCLSISPNSIPVFLKVIPAPNAKLHECGNNVNQYQSVHNGKNEYGWIIWHWPNIVFEAEAHVVWVDESSERQDITPHVEETNGKILFLPDDAAIEQYGQSHNDRFPPNHIQACTESLLAKEYAELQSKVLATYWAKGGSGVSIEEAIIEIGSQSEICRFSELEKIFDQKVEWNEPCSCQSGLK